MSLIANEQTKLTAAALNTAATSSFTVGVLAPVAAAFYNVGGKHPCAARCSHRWRGTVVRRRCRPTYRGKDTVEGAEAMTDTQLFAFVILPVVVAALGWGVVLWHNHWIKRQ